MANNKGAVIFLAIIAVGALGLSGYLFAMDLLAEPPEIEEEEPGYTLVALWDQLHQNTADNPSHSNDNDFLVEFDDNIILNPAYVNNISNTRFGFYIPGFYKITLNALFNGLVADQTCWIYMLENDTSIAVVDRIDMPNPAHQFYHVDATFYINATTDMYYEINPTSALDFWHVGDTAAFFNSLAIEYLGI